MDSSRETDDFSVPAVEAHAEPTRPNPAIVGTNRPAPRLPLITPQLRRALLALAAGVATLAGMAATVLLLDALDVRVPDDVAAVAAGIAFAGLLLILGASALAVLSIVSSLWTREPISMRSCLRALMATSVVLFGLLFAGTFLVGARGRQIRRRGRVLLPRLAVGRGWLLRPSALDSTAAASTEADPTQRLAADSELRAELARAWRENGRNEHASVSAFARLTLDLMALGAPAQLLRDAQNDALDEIRHAELCFSLARDLDGSEVVPDAFPEGGAMRRLPVPRVVALAMLAVDSLVDGAVHEGVSARVVARLAKRCEVPAIRAVLREIAEDEGRHAAHGWHVVRWCVEVGGEPVGWALRGALATLERSQSRRELRAGQADGRGDEWERFGIPSSKLEAAELQRTHADIAERVAGLLGVSAGSRSVAAS